MFYQQISKLYVLLKSYQVTASWYVPVIYWLRANIFTAW